MATSNFNKFQKARQELEEAEDRADQNERQDLKFKVLTRSSLSCSRSDLFNVSFRFILTIMSLRSKKSR